MSSPLAEPLNILMVAAENDSLTGGKIGGVGDVMRDIPPALAELGCSVTTLVPSHGFLHTEQGAHVLGQVTFAFGLQEYTAELIEVPGKRPVPGVRHLVLHHDLFRTPDPETGHPRIYCNDPDDRPFATDASKLAAFCAAAAAALTRGALGTVDRLHLHDWHTGMLLTLLRFDPACAALRKLPVVFSIHNLSLQGIRPFEDHHPVEAPSGLFPWYPWLRGTFNAELVADTRWPGCFNPMAAGIRLAQIVHAVSPSYAEEILKPSNPVHGFVGGEGLERDLKRAHLEGRLIGVLNGIEYPDPPLPIPEPGTPPPPAPSTEQVASSWNSLLATLRETLSRWEEATPAATHALALERVKALIARGTRPRTVLTAVSRIVDQKVGLMLTPPEGALEPAIAAILRELGENGIVIILGAGSRSLEVKLEELAKLHRNFIFLRGYSNASAAALYEHGDYFLMPSAFEPCGISQMLAMRSGQPCVVHAVGGLKDTVRDGDTGFAFAGRTPGEQAAALVAAVRRAVRTMTETPANYRRMRLNAKLRRFPWHDAALIYMTRLYGMPARVESHPGA